ncbi:MAG: SDR family NAD(P)-dependent oxidoreductase [Verrucomicrobiales bacterium]
MRNILVSGANGGLGRAIAREFLEGDEKDHLWLGVHSRREQAEQLASVFPGRVSVINLDVTEPGSWDSAIEAVLKENGNIDVLVNNAGAHEDALVATMSDDAWQRVMELNLNGVFYGSRKAARPMLSQRNGRIINIASLSALSAPLGQANYASAKAGVLVLTRVLAKELARAGITVNAICPGYIETEAISRMDEAARKIALGNVPMRRFGTPQEVSVAVRFLACSQASYITGSVIKIDGGIY